MKKKTAVKTAKQLMGLSREVGQPPPLGVFKTQMDKALINLV